MDKCLERYVDSAFVYRYTQNPDAVRTEDDARKYGLNCVALAHLAIKALTGHELPPDLLCAELYADRERFDHTEDLKDLRAGDLVWFGIENPSVMPDAFMPRYEGRTLVNWDEFPVKHVAVYTGDRDVQGEALLLNATFYAGTNVVWPLSQFSSYRRYKKIYGASRLRNIDIVK